ncbi:MAG: hypothetical protein K8T26_09450 [Lentisphaerae bacterium]|nr:hypothetical protein [Lentisphaerota bacterium]
MVTSMGCKTATDKITEPSAAYRAALAATAPGDNPPLIPGSQEERAALARVMAMFETFSTSNVTDHVRIVYATDAYLRDGFKELHGVEAIAPYMIRSTEPHRRCTFQFEDVTSKHGEYYLRWIMVVNLKRDRPERVEQVVGMSHMRFNAAGQVIFQQDYWDPSDVLYSRIPVAGWMINKVKAGL